LNVGAEDQGTGNVEMITITNDKSTTEGRSKEMIKAAEQSADEGKKLKEHVDVKNSSDG
jgi:molecular chaperone DnaK (HSP70)